VFCLDIYLNKCHNRFIETPYQKSFRMKMVGYVRVSSESQAENTSLESQKRRIQAYCEAYQYDLIAIFEEIGSAKDTESRPQFQAALEMVRTEADGIVALKLDRIARNTRDVLALVEDTLQPQNKSLVLLDLGVDTSTPTGKMILTVMAAVATLERDVINERTQGGRKAKAEAGGYAYGSPKFGMRSVGGKLAQDDRETEALDLIRRHRKSGKSYQAIANYLNAKGIPAKRGGEWSAKTVQRILK
jgi:site-specific DNA recombinase